MMILRAALTVVLALGLLAAPLAAKAQLEGGPDLDEGDVSGRGGQECYANDSNCHVGE